MSDASATAERNAYAERRAADATGTPKQRLFAGWHLERRPDPRRIGLYRVSAMLLGVVICVLAEPLFATTSAASVFNTAWTGTLGSAAGRANVLTYAVPLVIGGLAVSIPLRVGRWNVGVDGQIYLGAWLATAVALSFPHLASVLLIPFMLVAGMAGGALWIAGPALARSFWGVSEIITTFLLNFVGLSWLTYWVVERWSYSGIAGGGLRARPLPQNALLSPLHVGGTGVPAGTVLVVLLPVIVWAFVRFSRLGYELTLTGANERASRIVGIRVRRTQLVAMLAGGALAGLAGTVDMSGNVGSFGIGLANNYGLAAVAVAVLAGGSEIGVLFIGLLYACLLAQNDAIGITGVSSDLILGLIGITLLLGAMGEAFARLHVVHTRRSTTRPEPKPKVVECITD